MYDILTSSKLIRDSVVVVVVVVVVASTSVIVILVASMVLIPIANSLVVSISKIVTFLNAKNNTHLHPHPHLHGHRHFQVCKLQ